MQSIYPQIKNHNESKKKLDKFKHNPLSLPEVWNVWKFKCSADALNSKVYAQDAQNDVYAQIAR